jgi:hypothetical protein
MTVAYDPSAWYAAYRFFKKGSAIKAVLYCDDDKSFYVMLASFPVIVGIFWMSCTKHDAETLKNQFGYVMALLSGVFSYQITNYTGRCYSRYEATWYAAMTGMSRLNDLAVQVHAHIAGTDHWLACEIMRLMHAANHYVYLDMAGQTGPNHDLLVRRDLLSSEELSWLQNNGVNCGYQCACWALRLIHRSVASGNLGEITASKMEQSIIEWRRSTTLIPCLAMFPVPFVYYHTMRVELVVFQYGCAIYFTLLAFLNIEETPDGGEIKGRAFYISLVLGALGFVVISLFYQGLYQTCVMLFDPWSDDGPGFPIEEYMVLPLAVHKKLFAGAISPSMPEAYRSTQAAGKGNGRDKTLDADEGNATNGDYSGSHGLREPLLMAPPDPLDQSMLSDWQTKTSSGLLNLQAKANFRRLDELGPLYQSTKMSLRGHLRKSLKEKLKSKKTFIQKVRGVVRLHRHESMI